MAGLLNLTDDPTTLGLLSLGLRLMSTPGKFSSALGQSGLGAMDDVLRQSQLLKEQKRRDEEMKLRAEQAQRMQAEFEAQQRARQQQEAIANAATQYMRAPMRPDTMDDRDVGQPGEAPVRPTFDMRGYTDRLYSLPGGLPLAIQLESMQQKQRPELKSFDSAHDLYEIDANGNRRLVRPGKSPADKPTDDIREYSLYVEQELKNGRKPADFTPWMRENKKAGAAAGASVTLQSPVPVLNPDGTVGFLQPGNRPGAPAQQLINPANNKPAVKPPDAGSKPGAEIQRMNIGADSMLSLLDDYERWLKNNNPRDPLVIANPTKRAEASAKLANIQTQYKELVALGALTGPDLILIDKVLTDPFTFKGAFFGSDGLLGQITQARNLVRTRKEAMGTSSGQAARPAQNDDPLGIRGGK